jgi:hypothetical protein
LLSPVPHPAVWPDEVWSGLLSGFSKWLCGRPVWGGVIPGIKKYRDFFHL